MAIGFWMNNKNCYGCKTCSIACKSEKQLDKGVLLRHVTAIRQDAPRAFAYLSMACNHCEMPACVANCPQGALEKDADTGLVSRDEEKCIGCGTCVKSCPYEVPVVDTETMKSMKCDGCAARVAEGKMPICVDACPLRALEFGDIEELRTAHPDAVDGIAPMASPDQTKPSVAILACPAAKDCGDATGFIANPKEVENA